MGYNLTVCKPETEDTDYVQVFKSDRSGAADSPIVAGAALLVPPFLNIETVVIQDETNSNLNRGAVVYARQADPSAVEEGDKILRVTEDGAVNSYIVRTYDASSKTVTAVKSEGAAEEELHASDTVRRILLLVPYLGFLSIATQSITGLLILGGFILIIIILFVISEVLRRGSEEDEDEDGNRVTDEEYFSSLHGKKTEAFDAQKADEAPSQTEESFPVDGEGEAFIKNLKGAISGNDLSGTGTISAPSEEEHKAAPDEEDPVSTDGLPDVQAALEAALEGRQVGYGQNTQQGGTAEEAQAPKTGEIELAIPIRSADELLDAAHAAGDDPELRKDEMTGVSFVDYTDCL